MNTGTCLNCKATNMYLDEFFECFSCQDKFLKEMRKLSGDKSNRNNERTKTPIHKQAMILAGSKRVNKTILPVISIDLQEKVLFEACEHYKKTFKTLEDFLDYFNLKYDTNISHPNYTKIRQSSIPKRLGLERINVIHRKSINT